MSKVAGCAWSQDGRPSSFILAFSFHVLSPRQFGGRFLQSGLVGSLDSSQTCRTSSMAFRSRCNLGSSRAFLALREGGSYADALIGFRSWQAVKLWEPKPSAAEPFSGSNR